MRIMAWGLFTGLALAAAIYLASNEPALLIGALVIGAGAGIWVGVREVR